MARCFTIGLSGESGKRLGGASPAEPTGCQRAARARRIVWRCLALAAASLLAADAVPRPAPVLWAWERPEDLRFAGPDVAIAVLAGTITLSGDRVLAEGRRQPLSARPDQRRIAVVHVELDRHAVLAWSPALRDQAAAAALAFAGDVAAAGIQLDFEVRESERSVLLDLLKALRARLGPERFLSMTALASWCDTEHWIAAAPVDEIVPMLFRMGPGGARLRQRLEAGGDFREQRCRGAVGIATDQPPVRLPPGRRVYVYNPHRWQQADLSAILQEASLW